MRNKLPDNEKRKAITTTIDSKINNMLEEWMKDNNYDNKSKVIERLILNEINKQKKSE
jgi:metal-responsive CopG/Arc/MetJ family transcriptional regulator